MAKRFLGISKVAILTLVVLSFVLANSICTSLVSTSQFPLELESESTDECERECNEAIFARQRLRRIRDLDSQGTNFVYPQTIKPVGAFLQLDRVTVHSLSARLLPLLI